MLVDEHLDIMQRHLREQMVHSEVEVVDDDVIALDERGEIEYLYSSIHLLLDII